MRVLAIIFTLHLIFVKEIQLISCLIASCRQYPSLHNTFARAIVSLSSVIQFQEFAPFQHLVTNVRRLDPLNSLLFSIFCLAL